MPRFGYVAQSRLLDRTTNRTCRLGNATPQRLRELVALNLDALAAILEFNVTQGWALFRIGSGVVPFASHPDVQFDWLAASDDRLAAIGRYARAHGLRLSMHPGQYTILNSPDAEVRASAVAELAYSAQFLDALGLDRQHKIVLHVGGIYGDKPAARARFATYANALPESIRARLVVEHDDRRYTLADALAIHAETGLPVVYDNLHHDLNPSEEPLEVLLPHVFASWQADDGPPKIHFSTQAAGERPGKHARYADPDQFRAVLKRCAPIGEFDVMLEVKAKDAALQRVLAAL